MIEHGGRPPGSFSAKAAPGMISVTPTMQAAASAFFNSSSPVAVHQSAGTPPVRPPSGHRCEAAYTALVTPTYTGRHGSSQELSGTLTLPEAIDGSAEAAVTRSDPDF